MQVILLEKVRNLVGVGDKVNVKPGYGRNYLIPHSKAVQASAANVAAFEAKRAELEKHAKEILAAANTRAESITGKQVTIKAKASEEGKLFGSISAREIAEAITAEGCVIERKEIDLPEGPIRQVGEHTVMLQLHSDISIKIQVKVVASE